MGLETLLLMNLIFCRPFIGQVPTSRNNRVAWNKGHKIVRNEYGQGNTVPEYALDNLPVGILKNIHLNFRRTSDKYVPSENKNRGVCFFTETSLANFHFTINICQRFIWQLIPLTTILKHKHSYGKQSLCKCFISYYFKRQTDI